MRGGGGGACGGYFFPFAAVVVPRLMGDEGLDFFSPSPVDERLLFVVGLLVSTSGSTST